MVEEILGNDSSRGTNISRNWCRNHDMPIHHYKHWDTVMALDIAKKAYEIGKIDGLDTKRNDRA